MMALAGQEYQIQTVLPSQVSTWQLSFVSVRFAPLLHTQAGKIIGEYQVKVRKDHVIPLSLSLS